MEETLMESNDALQKALTELEQTQTKVIQQERLRAVGEMASGIAHDVNNSLAPIAGFSELLLLRPELLQDPDRSKRYLSLIHPAAQDAAHTIGRLKEFYRHRGADEPFVSVALGEVVEEVIELSRPKWKDQAQGEGKHIGLRSDLKTVPRISGNPSNLREVVTNLVFNAVDAINGDGTVTLALLYEPERDRVILEVRDTGRGMDEATRLRCLEPFFTTKGEQGTGLRLSMVYGIVHRHSGEIEIESEEGLGTVFRLSFPPEKGNLEIREAVRAGEGITTALRRILLVEDEPAVRELIEEVLTGEGHSVVTAEDGERGFARFSEGRFDVVTTDKAMPGMNGEQLALAIRQKSPDTPVLLMTGFGEFMNATGENRAGVDRT
jgi:nitrogen-specific signal transduction histidine kinase